MITGMDRLVAAIQGKTSDRIPVFCNLLDQGAAELGMGLQEYYSKGEYVAQGQLKMRERYGYDNVWALFYVGKEAELLGCKKIRFTPYGPPNVEHFVIQSHDDVHNLVIPDDLESHPPFAETLKCLDILKAEVGGKYPICVYLSSAMALPALLMGMEKWLELLLMGPAEVRDELLAKCSDLYQKQAAVLRKHGADVLVYSHPFGSTDFMPLKMIEQISFPWMARDLAPGGVEGVVYYCGSARFNRVIPQVMERFKLGTYYLSPLDDLAEAKAMIGDKGLTCGVINDIKLIDWSPEEVRQEVKRLIEAGKPGSHFLFGTLVMPLAIPEANIRAMLEAAYEYGRWP